MNFDTPNLIDEDNFCLEAADMDNKDENKMMPHKTGSSWTDEKQNGMSSLNRRSVKCWKKFTL